MSTETIITILIAALSGFFLFFKKGSSSDNSELGNQLQKKIDDIKNEVDKLDNEVGKEQPNLDSKEAEDYWKKQ